jgi:hypothetical protein
MNQHHSPRRVHLTEEPQRLIVTVSPQRVLTDWTLLLVFLLVTLFTGFETLAIFANVILHWETHAWWILAGVFWLHFPLVFGWMFVNTIRRMTIVQTIIIDRTDVHLEERGWFRVRSRHVAKAEVDPTCIWDSKAQELIVTSVSKKRLFAIPYETEELASPLRIAIGRHLQ